MNLYVNARLVTSQKENCLQKSENEQINLRAVLHSIRLTLLVFTCSKSTTETSEQCVKSVNDVVPVSLMLTLNRFHTLF